MSVKAPTATTLLTTLSLIKANADRGHTHLDNFGPFILEAMRDSPDEAYSPHRAATLASEVLGLQLPPKVAEAILKRLARQHWVTREDGEYRLRPEKVGDLPNLRAERAKFTRQQQALVDAFITFAQVQHDIELRPEAAAQALYAQIEHDTVDLLKMEIRGSSYEAREHARHKHAYLVADFITEAHRADQASYEAILSAAKGSMLAAAIHLPNLEKVESRFNKTTLYLDAPLLLQIVGLEGPDAENAVFEIIRLAMAAGAEVATFEHSVTEAEGVILANVEARKRGNRVPGRAKGIEAYAIKANLDAGDLQMEFGKFRSNLTRMRIAITEKPDSDQRIEVDELALHDELDAAVGGYRTMEALLKDVDSLRAIHFLRRGSSSSTIENCKAVLITDNDAVARVARDFFKAEGYQWPVATNISDLATIMYLKAPQEASSLPELRLVADAYSALEPGLQVWSKFLDAIERQNARKAVSAEDIALLCHTQESRRALMDTTMGRHDRVSEETVERVLERAKALASAPARAESRTAHAQAAEAGRREEAATAERDAAAARAAELELRVKVAEAARNASAEHADSISTAISISAARKAKRWLFAAVGIPALVMVAAGSTPILGWAPAGRLGAITKAAAVLVGVVLLVMTVLRNVYGGHLTAWLGPLERRISSRIEAGMRRDAGLPRL